MAPVLNKDPNTAGKPGNAPTAGHTSSRPATPSSQATGQKASSGSEKVPGSAAVGGGRQALPSNPQGPRNSSPSRATGIDPAVGSRKPLGGATGGDRTPSPPRNPQASGSVTPRKVSAGSSTSGDKRSPPPTIVWACDGTGQSGTNQSGKAKSHRSNVYKLWHMFNKVLPADNGKHKALYHDGPASGMQGNLKDKLEAAGPAATGSEVQQCIKDGLRELSHNYDDSDFIILIGFSRGAFVVRCLHSLIHLLGGLIGNCTDDNFNEAYQTWYDKKEITKEQWKAWKIRPARVRHLVLFDTVNSVRKAEKAFQADQRFAEVDSTLEGSVDYFSHAMALNDPRQLFLAIPITSCEGSHTKGTNVYFAGVHSNIGGGHDATGLDLIPLGWAACEITSKSKITFNAQDVADLYDSISVEWNMDFVDPSYSIEPHTSRIPAYQSLHRQLWKDISQGVRDRMFELHFSVRAIIDGSRISNMQYPEIYAITPLSMDKSSSQTLGLEDELKLAYQKYNANRGRTITVPNKPKDTTFHINESRISRIEAAYLKDFCEASRIVEHARRGNPTARDMRVMLAVMKTAAE